MHYVQHGADFIRLDGLAHLENEPGPDGRALPHAQHVVQVLRAVLDLAAPWVQLTSLPGGPHATNAPYSGAGEPGAPLVYQAALPALILYAYSSGQARVITEWAAALPAPTPATTFLNFTASPDGIGVEPARGPLSEAQLAFLYQRVAEQGGKISSTTHADGSTSPYELNTTFLDALIEPGEPLARTVARFIGSQAAMLALAGCPAIYLPSLLGARNWRAGFYTTGHARSLNREKFTLGALIQTLAHPEACPTQVLHAYREWLKIRRGEPAFHPEGDQRVLDLHPAVFALERTAPDGSAHLLALHNVLGLPVAFHLPRGVWRNLQTAATWSGHTTLRSYQVAWLREC